MRFAVGGFQHETNTFAPEKADMAAFAQQDAWPGLQRGNRLLKAFDGMNIPSGGFIEYASKSGHDLAPLTWCHATPSAHVTRDAFETVAGMILEDLRDLDLDSLDGVYLDLHGAMVTEHFEDGEGELLRRVRRLVGAEMPLVASLDLHANITAAMVRHADVLVAYRTYPHVDMAETGARAAALLEEIAERGFGYAKAFRKLDFLIPLTAQCTLEEPGALIASDVAVLEDCELDEGYVASASFAPGFPLADIRECGPAILAYADTQGAAQAAVNGLVREITDLEPAFSPVLWSASDAVAHALGHCGEGEGPFVIADTQDNPGAGGNGDTVGLLRELIEQDARGSVLGVLYDPEAAAIAHRAGRGALLPDLLLGAKSGGANEEPLIEDFEVVSLSDGHCIGSGPYYRGAEISLGATARLRHRGVEVIVASKKVQCADQSIFRHIGVEPAKYDIVAVKSSVHFRADFGRIARKTLVAACPGPNTADHTQLAFKRLRPGLRVMPMGPAFAG